MRSHLLLLTLLSTSQPAWGQLEMDSMLMYTSIHRMGTTACLLHYHKDLASREAPTETLNDTGLAELKALFSGSRKKRFFQQKHAGTIWYAVVWHKGKRYDYILEETTEIARLVNLNSMRQWSLEESGKIDAVHVLMKRYYPQAGLCGSPPPRTLPVFRPPFPSASCPAPAARLKLLQA